MKNLLTKLNNQNLIEPFKDCSVKFFVKNYESTLVIAIRGELPVVENILTFIDLMKSSLERTNFRKFELYISLNNDSDKLTIAKKLIESNYPYNCSVNDEKLIVDTLNLKYSSNNTIYIDELLKNLEIDVYKNVEYVNLSVDNDYDINHISKMYIKNNTQENSQSSKYLANFQNTKALDIELSVLPKTKEELQNMQCPKVLVEGQIFSFESKNTKKSTLYTIKITNYKESAVLKLFSNDEVKVKEGDSVKAVGVLMFDDFTKQIVIQVSNASDIQKINANFIKEISLEGLFDEEEQIRTELHVHTKFSTQDGLTSVKEYCENAKKFGIESLAFVDHENVQAYPDIEKYSKEFGIKPIYGVELNVVNKSDYKIFYKGNSTKNHVVGIDIETTGFSAIYDEIIEISAYKILNGQKSEYSVLVKLDDYKKLSNKITDLTGIDKSMLIKDGIDIKTALNGLIEFIDDGVLVAHNASFDVHFLQQKITQYLGVVKNYSYIDTLNFSRNILNGQMKKFALNYVCKKLKIELVEHHRAIYDAIACLEIYYSLMNKLENIDLSNENCPDTGDIHIDVKVASKKTKNIVEEFINNNSNNYKEENKSGENSTRVNSIYSLILSNEGYSKLLELIEKNPTIKCSNAYREVKIYSENYENLNNLISEEEILANARNFHVTLLLKNQIGLKQLYKLISLSNTKRITSKGNIVFLEDIINSEIRENVLLGSSCVNGIFKSIFEKGFKYCTNYDFLDYIEIQPLDAYLSVCDSIYSKDYIRDCIDNIIEKAKKDKKVIVASCDAHYIYPKFKEYRDVYVNTFAVGGVRHPLYGSTNTGTHILYSTNNLIKKLKEDYNYDLRFIKKIVLENTKKINSLVDDNIKIIPDKLYTPNDDFLKDKILDVVGYKVPSIKEEFEKIVNESVKKYMILNGINKLPNYIKKRLDKELNSIIGHGFYIIYYIAYLLVKQSNKDGYVVGSRGSVGSSFVAYLMGITEVNALAPHYLCPKCHFQIYKGTKDIFKNGVDARYRKAVESVDDGFDLPQDNCPFCKSKLIRDGHDIPFETFLGFNGDKTPDIDLNFSGEYQSKAHDFCKIVFGEEHAFRAGTIATVASKTAESYLRQYYIKNGKNVSDAEINRRSQNLTDVKRTTGQHPGGIIVLPSNMSIYDFTPIQYPANKPQNWFTTHLDYNAIHENVLKMDILGHDDPTILKFLMDLVHENPENYPFNNPKDIPIDDEKIMHFLRHDNEGVIKSLGVPEFGTNFVKGMLSDIQPKTFYDLVKTSGLSHGTDVWTTNAQDLVNGVTEFGKIDFKDVIGCRDDIMVQLIYAGLEQKQAFDIMEFVRKGKVAKEPEKWNQFKKIMIEHNVPKWYIWSCERIKYMFPKAHAVAYVLSAMRIAWFKANRPLDFYQAFFTVRANVFDAKTIMTNNTDIIQSRIDEIKGNKAATDVELDSVPYLETALEMIKMGFSFKEPIVNLSHGTKFTKLNNKCLLMPFSILDGVGKVTANSVYENRGEIPYKDITDLKQRGKADKKFIDSMNNLNALNF